MTLEYLEPLKYPNSLKYSNRVSYEELGEKNEEIIIFLHPKLLANWVWDKQKENYNQCFRKYHCIYINLPNHRNNTNDKNRTQHNIIEDFSIKKSANIIIKFIEEKIELKNRNPPKNSSKNSAIDKSKNNFKDKSKNSPNNNPKINIVSIGLGGLIAIEIIKKRPDLVNNLILSGVNIPNKLETKENSYLNYIAKARAKYWNTKTDQFIVKSYLRYYGISKSKYYNQMKNILEYNLKEEMDIAFESTNYNPFLKLEETKQIKEEIKGNSKKEIEKEFNKQLEKFDKINTLIIYGNKEDQTIVKSSLKLKNIIKNSKLIEIDKGTHLWCMSNSKLFNSVILTFIKKNEIFNDTKVFPIIN